MTFRHSGKLGDIVYSLAAVQAFPGSTYLVNADTAHLHPTTAEAIFPLLEAQPCIARAELWSGQPFDHDFDAFREHSPIVNSLADCHLATLGLDFQLRSSPWLSGIEPRPLPGAGVLFSRSSSFHGAPGIMSHLYMQFGRAAAFVGSESEYRAFCDEVGPLSYVKTANLLELAQVIAGCRLFIGNQSCPLALAEALKAPLFQEVCHDQPNCIFYRSGAYPIWDIRQIPGAVREFFLFERSRSQ